VSRPTLALAVGDALRAGAGRLRAAGCDSPRLDAELLLAEVLGVDRARLLLDGARELTPGEADSLESLVRRRERREPVAYLLGRKPFRRLEVAVDPRVLIPRPETELLVEVGLDLPRGARVVDVGTGSGAVALALKHERPDLRVTGVDASPDALAVARANAARLGLDVAFAQADLLAGAGGPFDAVLANLPYVSPEEWERLPREIHHEPREALVAADGGLAEIRRVIAQAGPAGSSAGERAGGDAAPTAGERTGRSAAPGEGAGAAPSLLAVEVGAGQARAVAAAMRAAGFARVEARRDLAGIERVVVGRGPGGPAPAA
jgi:release factor glutamine methyltransferase